MMEGPRSACFKRFRELCVKTFMELRRQRHKIILLVEMVVSGNENLPCFGGRPQVRACVRACVRAALYVVLVSRVPA